MKQLIAHNIVLQILILIAFWEEFLCQQIKVWIDHKNITWDALSLNSNCIMRRRLLLEEYQPTILDISDTMNGLADPVSRIDMDPTYQISVEI